MRGKGGALQEDALSAGSSSRSVEWESCLLLDGYLRFILFIRFIGGSGGVKAPENRIRGCLMQVWVEKGKLGISTYRIWDNDGREIACHKQGVLELIQKLNQALREDK